MAADVASTVEDGLGNTERRDAWWVGPLLTALVLGGFIIYATGRAVLGHGMHAYGYDGDEKHVTILEETHAHVLSPFFSPLLIIPNMPAWWSPAFLILWAPGGFRLTCYYYRKAYYRAFFWDPPGCAVGEVKGNRYMGETGLMIFQNLHRFFMYVAIIFIVILSLDVVWACMWPTDDGGMTFGVSVGTLVLLANTTLLALYTFSCHSLRHLIGGNMDCFSCVAMGDARYKAWKTVSSLNKHHMAFAWVSLFGVGLADFYVWMVASGTITDVRLI